MKLSEQTLRPEAVGYCFILLVSYYEQSQAPLLPPFTQSFHEHLSGRVQMLLLLPRTCWLQGREGPLPRLQLDHSVRGLVPPPLPHLPENSSVAPPLRLSV